MWEGEGEGGSQIGSITYWEPHKCAFTSMLDKSRNYYVDPRVTARIPIALKNMWKQIWPSDFIQANINDVYICREQDQSAHTSLLVRHNATQCTAINFLTITLVFSRVTSCDEQSGTRPHLQIGKLSRQHAVKLLSHERFKD